MGGEPFFDADSFARAEDPLLDPLVVHGSGKGTLLGEEPFPRSPRGGKRVPVAEYHPPERVRQGHVAVLPVLRAADMDLVDDVGVRWQSSSTRRPERNQR